MDFDVAELPVMVGGKDSRIDFVLRHQDKSAYLIAECKRVNPAFTDWCFFRAPIVRRDEDGPQFWIELWQRDPTDYHNAFLLEGKPKNGARGRDYHIAFPVEGQLKGDKSGGDPKATIENALTQVARHANGFAKLLCDRPEIVHLGHDCALIVPAIFTTARLWVSDVDLAKTTLATGRFEDSLQLKQCDWLAFQYHMSQGLRPTHVAMRTTDLSTYLVQDVLRTIFVVSTAGIGEFLEFIGEIL